MTPVPFWSNDIPILFDKKYMCEVWPTNKMALEQKMNAITRIVILLSIGAFMYTRQWNFVIIGAVTIAIICAVYRYNKRAMIANNMREGFSDNKKPAPKEAATTTNPVTLDTVLKSDFHPVTKQNPMGNMLLTDIMDNPDRKAAQPSFNPDVYDDINKAVKKQTQMLNPTIKNTNKQIYGDLKDNYDLDNSMMRFYSTANTRVGNDQGGFANYLYGDMHSAKEDTPEGAMMRVKDNVRYLLI